MKKYINFIIPILFIFVVVIMLVYYKEYKKNNKIEVSKLETNLVYLTEGKADTDIIIDDITIYNLKIKNKIVTFNIKSKTTDLNEKMLTITLINTDAVASGVYENIYLEEKMDKNNEVIVDTSEYYNNPNQIKIEIT